MTFCAMSSPVRRFLALFLSIYLKLFISLAYICGIRISGKTEVFEFLRLRNVRIKRFLVLSTVVKKLLIESYTAL
jgi:hypothetical protein